MAGSLIEWTDRTWNPGVWGCAKEGPECLRCYAMSLAHRLSAQGIYPDGITRSPGGGDKGAQWTGRVLVASPEDVRESARGLYRRLRPDGRRWRIFTTSMGDLFHADVPFWFLDAVFEEMVARPWIDFQVLTKRADRMAAYDASLAAQGLPWPSNVWAGVTAGTQKGADERGPHLLKVRAAVRFLSCEPLLECLDVVGLIDERATADGATVNWVITGCESGTRPRQTDPDWYRSLRDQCAVAGIPFFLKQADLGHGIESLPLLDGRAWAMFPTVTP
jgi:protein gp37